MGSAEQELATTLSLEAESNAPSLAETVKFRQGMGQVSRQSFVFLAGSMFTTAAGYFFKIYLARFLGAELLGTYALGMTVVGFAGLFSTLGLSGAAPRFVAVYSGTGDIRHLRGFLWRGLGIVLLGSTVLATLMVFSRRWIAAMYHTPALATFMPLFAILGVLGIVNGFYGQVLAGFKDVTKRTVVNNFIASPLMMIFTIALVTWGTGFWGYLVAQVGSATVTLLLLATIAWRLTPAPARLSWAPLPPLQREVISFSTVIFTVGVLEFLLGQVDKVLLGLYLHAREVGIYATAMALVTFVPIILQAVNQIFSPMIADLHARGERQVLGRLYQTLTKWILGFTVPLALVMMIFSAPLMRLFGPDFEAGWPILVVGSMAQLVNCGVGSVGYLLLMSGNQNRLLKVQTVMAVFTIVLNISLIPVLGILGAASAGALVTVVSNFWYLREVRKALGLSPSSASYRELLLPVFSAIVVVVLLRIVFRNFQPAWVIILAALVSGYVVFVLNVIALGLKDDDRVLARIVWARARGVFQKAAVGA